MVGNCTFKINQADCVKFSLDNKFNCDFGSAYLHFFNNYLAY